jgi:hypothetical protein
VFLNQVKKYNDSLSFDLVGTIIRYTQLTIFRGPMEGQLGLCSGRLCVAQQRQPLATWASGGFVRHGLWFAESRVGHWRPPENEGHTAGRRIRTSHRWACGRQTRVIRNLNLLVAHTSIDVV